MAQIATTHDKKPADQPRTNADRAADLARDARDQGRKLAHDVAETTSSMVKRTAANTVAAAGIGSFGSYARHAAGARQ